MEFIKVGKNYMIKGSNGRIVSEEEKLKIENKELILKDIEGCECQKETTKKLSKNKKRLKEIEEKEFKEELDKHLVSHWENKEPLIDKVQLNSRYDTNYKTAQEKGDSADDIIKETN